MILPYLDKTGQTNMHIHAQENKNVHNKKADHGCKKAGKYLSKNAFV